MAETTPLNVADPNRCDRAFVGNTLGMVSVTMPVVYRILLCAAMPCGISDLPLLAQANAVSDKLLDLRSCVYTGKNLADKVLSGALVADADFSNTVMSNVTMTKSYAKGANFSGMQQLPLANVALLSKLHWRVLHFEARMLSYKCAACRLRFN